MAGAVGSEVNVGVGAEEIERSAREISKLAREHAEETEQGRQLAPALLERLRESGLMLAGAPVEAGGLELAPGLALRCAEEIARGDASAGWCVSIATTASLLIGYLSTEAREELFCDRATIAAGIFAPRGSGRPVEGGVLVDGRWPYCSGIRHAGVLFAGCFIAPGGEAAQRPLPSVVAMPRSSLEVLDTWHTLGLRGTGSHDTLARELLVPLGHSFSLFDGPRVDRPLYRFPPFGYFALSVAAAALGNARGALDDFSALARDKVGQGSTRTLAERAPTQAAVGEAEAALRAAHLLFFDAIEAAWEAVQEPEPVPVELRRDLRLAATHAARTAADVVRALYDLAGGSAIYDGTPMQRRFRDAFTATAHFQVNAASFELAGRMLLDQPTDTVML